VHGRSLYGRHSYAETCHFQPINMIFQDRCLLYIERSKNLCSWACGLYSNVLPEHIPGSSYKSHAPGVPHVFTLETPMGHLKVSSLTAPIGFCHLFCHSWSKREILALRLFFSVLFNLAKKCNKIFWNLKQIFL
jgi:hypothetical protein